MTNSKELMTLDPENMLHSKFDLERSTVSEECDVSFCGRARMAYIMRCFRSIVPVLISIRTDLSFSFMSCLLRV